MPFPEWHDWELFYLLEPWGWHDREYRTAIQLAKLHNSNATKRSHIKKIIDFVRDMVIEIKEALKEPITLEELTKDMSPDERAAYIKNLIKRDFGIN